jgi:hypothetical protein
VGRDIHQALKKIQGEIDAVIKIIKGADASGKEYIAREIVLNGMHNLNFTNDLSDVSMNDLERAQTDGRYRTPLGGESPKGKAKELFDFFQKNVKIIEDKFKKKYEEPEKSSIKDKASGDLAYEDKEMTPLFRYVKMGESPYPKFHRAPGQQEAAAYAQGLKERYTELTDKLLNFLAEVRDYFTIQLDWPQGVYPPPEVKQTNAAVGLKFCHYLGGQKGKICLASQQYQYFDELYEQVYKAYYKELYKLFSEREGRRGVTFRNPVVYPYTSRNVVYQCTFIYKDVVQTSWDKYTFREILQDGTSGGTSESITADFFRDFYKVLTSEGEAFLNEAIRFEKAIVGKRRAQRISGGISLAGLLQRLNEIADEFILMRQKYVRQHNAIGHKYYQKSPWLTIYHITNEYYFIPASVNLINDQEMSIYRIPDLKGIGRKNRTQPYEVGDADNPYIKKKDETS